MLKSKNIVQNTVLLTGALILQKVISYVFFLALAKFLGTTGTGEYVAAFSLTGLFSVFVDLGLSNVLVREIAKEPQKASLYFRNALGLKIVLGTLTYVGLILIALFFDIGPSVSLIAVAGIVMLLDSLVLTAASVFRGWHNLAYESISVVVQKIGVLIAGIGVLYVAPSPVNVVVAIILGGVVGYGLVIYFLRYGLQSPLWPTFNWQMQAALLRMAWPFALAGFFAMGYSYIDSIMLSIYKDAEAVGLYSVASKTMNAFVFIPAAFVAGLYPAMSAAAIDNEARVREFLSYGLKYLLLIGAPISAGLFMLADQFVALLGEDYSRSVLAVQILLPSLPLMFLTYPVGSLLNATGRQSWQTGILGVGLLFNVCMNIWLIPHWSFIGASISWSISNLIMFVVGSILIRKYIQFSVILFSLFKICLAAILMIGVLYYVASWPLLLVIIFGATVYLCALVGLREITTRDVVRVLSLIKNEK